MPHGSVPEAVARLEEQVHGVHTKVDRICVLLEGDGTNDSPGLKVAVDRLTQSEKRRAWAFRAITTGFIGLAAERVFGYFIK